MSAIGAHVTQPKRRMSRAASTSTPSSPSHSHSQPNAYPSSSTANAYSLSISPPSSTSLHTQALSHYPPSDREREKSRDRDRDRSRDKIREQHQAHSHHPHRKPTFSLSESAVSDPDDDEGLRYPAAPRGSSWGGERSTQWPGGGGTGGGGYAPAQVLVGDGKGVKEKDGGPVLFGIELKWISLLTLALQNAFLTIIMHYSRITSTPSQTYSAASAVLLNELLKCSISLFIALKRIDLDMSRMEGNNGYFRSVSPAMNSSDEQEEEEGDVISPVVTKPPKKRFMTVMGGGSKGGVARAGVPTNKSARGGRQLGGVPITMATLPYHLAGFTKASRWRRLYTSVFSPDCWKLSIPAILYVIQNNLQYTAASNLDVATFQVTYQMKILTTAFFSVLLLGKRLSMSKWLALLLLAVGVGIVQIQSGQAVSPDTVSRAIGNHTVASAVVAGAGHIEHEIRQVVEDLGAAGDIAGDVVVETILHQMKPLKGFLAVSAACMTSGLAGVYFEMVLKGSQADLWVRNVQLSLFSLAPALVPVLFGSAMGPAGIWGLFSNFGVLAWSTVLTQVFGGLITALVIKYSDNILKGFATSLSIVISFLASVGLFAYPITPAFVLGSSVVLAATWMYNQPAGDVAKTSGSGSTGTGGYSSRMGMAVPGSPITQDAPIIGITPRPSRTSSMVSLLGGLGNNGSRHPSRASTPVNGISPPAMQTEFFVNVPPQPIYRNGGTAPSPALSGYFTAPTTPYLSNTPNISAHPSNTSIHEQQAAYGRQQPNGVGGLANGALMMSRASIGGASHGSSGSSGTDSSLYGSGLGAHEGLVNGNGRRPKLELDTGDRW